MKELAGAAQRRFSKHTFVSDILDTAWDSAPARIKQLLNDKRPILALHFGVAREAQGFRIERQAANTCYGMPDVSAQLPPSPKLAENGPPILKTTLDADSIAARLAQLGFPAEVSDDAGHYLCNGVLYHSLAAAQDLGEACQVGFIHIPMDLNGPPLPFDRAIDGALAIIGYCLNS